MDKLESKKMGNIITQPTKYKAYIPNKLCDNQIQINYDDDMINLLSQADRALAELKGVTEWLKNPDLFIAKYIEKEALLSSQIEGTECSLDEVFQVDEKQMGTKPVHEVINYIKAMNKGLDKLESLPMSLRLMNEIHAILLKDVRGNEKNPGEFKRSQNWIGPPGCTLEEAVFVPPPPDKTTELMGDLEIFYHKEKKMPPLIESALLHYQFETIHPYADGNGRIGRLLITFMLCEKNVLTKPLLYLSLFFKQHKQDYFRILMDVRFKGELENWIKFFLRGVRNTSKEAFETAMKIRSLHNENFAKINEEASQYKLAHPLFDLLCKKPILSIVSAQKALDSNYPTTKRAIETFLDLDILYPYETQSSKDFFFYKDFLEILRVGTE